MMTKILTLVAAGGIALGDVSVSMAEVVGKARHNLADKKKVRAVQEALDNPPPPPPPPQQKRSAPQKPKSVLTDGLLGNSTGFSQGGPSAAGTLSAPSSGRGGSGQVIK